MDENRDAVGQGKGSCCCCPTRRTASQTDEAGVAKPPRRIMDILESLSKTSNVEWTRTKHWRCWTLGQPTRGRVPSRRFRVRSACLLTRWINTIRDSAQSIGGPVLHVTQRALQRPCGADSFKRQMIDSPDGEVTFHPSSSIRSAAFRCVRC